MPEYHGNGAYLSIGGRAMGGIARSFSPSLTTGDENTSHGFGEDWEKHRGKLSVINATATVVYDTDTAPTDIAAVCPSGKGDLVDVEYAPEGMTAGKLEFAGEMLVTGVTGPTVNYDKTLVLFEITLISNGAPTANLYGGDTVSA